MDAEGRIDVAANRGNGGERTEGDDGGDLAEYFDEGLESEEAMNYEMVGKVFFWVMFSFGCLMAIAAIIQGFCE